VVAAILGAETRWCRTTDISSKGKLAVRITGRIWERDPVKWIENDFQPFDAGADLKWVHPDDDPQSSDDD
jgi:hypothetical protein